MIDLIKLQQLQLTQLCLQHHVKSLEVFGSAASSSEFNKESSDIDFLVEFQPLATGTHAGVYFDLLEALENLFQRPIDLLMVRAIKNPYLLQTINQNRELLYAA